MNSGWTAVPNDALIDTSLSINARHLYSILRMYARPLDGQFKVWPGCETLARDMGVSVSTIKRALKELDDHGLITRKRRIGTSSLTYIHEYSGVTHELTEQLTSEPTISSPVSQKEDPVEEDPDKDPAPQKPEREVTVTEDEGDIPSEMSPVGNRLRSKKKSKVNHSFAEEVFYPLAGMWDKEAVALGYEPRDLEEMSGILPQVIKARNATGRKESPLNDPDAILAGLRKRAADGGFWLDKFKFRWLFASKAGSWYCRQLAHEGKQKQSGGMPVTHLSAEDLEGKE